MMSWEAFVQLAFTEIRMAGAGSPQVTRRLKSALSDLSSIAPADRLEILEHHLDLLRAATEGAMDDERDAELALRDDREGMGAAASLDRR
jgi:uncharacterized membrane protein